MVRVGIAGIGFMGKTHWDAYQQVEGVQVTAISTRDPKKLAGDWTGVRGNFGSAGGVVDLSGVHCHAELDNLVNDADVDLLDICLPSNIHRRVTEQAMDAGKHVLVEKPIALDLDDADAIIAKAEATGRLLLVAQVLRFWPEFALLKDLVDGGEYGALQGIHFKRVIARPDWGGDHWFDDPNNTGGPVVDLHIHDTDFIRYLLGDPASVSCSGVIRENGQIDYLVSDYDYPGRNLVVSSTSGAIAQKGREFEHGYDAYFERAMVTHNSTSQPGVEVIVGAGEPEILKPRITDAFVAQLQTVIDGVRDGVVPDVVSGVSGRESLKTVLAEAESCRTGQPVSLA